MRGTKILSLLAAGVLALGLSACGAGQAPAGAYQTHTFDFDGNVVDVTVDMRDDWDVAFSDNSAALYDGPNDGVRNAVAFGVYESQALYEARLAEPSACADFTQLEDGVTFTDSAGLQDYILDLGDGVHYRIMVQPGHDAQAIFDRFEAELLESAPPAPEPNPYLTLVNRTHKLPENWESRIDLLETKNYSQEDIRVEKNSHEAFQALRAALLAEGVDIELESCYRSVERQKEVWAEYEAAYGTDYCNQYVAVPGFSEHHTGFAIDVNLIQGDGQTDEAERQKERAALWAKVHAKLPEYGFILRYLQGKEDITGYAYEPWHIRYVGDPAIAREITQRGISLEEYLGQVEPANATVDYGTSALFTEAERKAAVAALRAELDTWTGCELHSIRYAGDGCCSAENLAWMNSLRENGQFTECIEFLTNFHSPAENSGGLDPDAEYIDYQWWLARTGGGDWELVTWSN